MHDLKTDQLCTEAPKKVIMSVSAISLNFDLVSNGLNKSPTDEIRVLLPKNKKPPRKSKEGKPPGFGLPTGQLESNEDMIRALERETRDETGYPISRVIGKAFVVYKHWIPNEIHVFFVENSDYPIGVREKEEIDLTVDPWHTLREIFSMSAAQGRGGENKNLNGIYFSHRQRLYRGLETMLRHPEDLIDSDKIAEWIKPNRKVLITALADLEDAGLLDEIAGHYTYPQDIDEITA